MPHTRDQVSETPPAPEAPPAEDTPEADEPEVDQDQEETDTMTTDTDEITEDVIGDRHLAGCPRERLEVSENRGPRGWVVVTRCIDCAAQVAAPATEYPTMQGGSE